MTTTICTVGTAIIAFIITDNIQSPSQLNYGGSFKVIGSNDKTVSMEKAGKTDPISIDGGKSAFIENDHQWTNADPSETVTSPRREIQPLTTGIKKRLQ